MKILEVTYMGKKGLNLPGKSKILVHRFLTKIKFKEESFQKVNREKDERDRHAFIKELLEKRDSFISILLLILFGRQNIIVNVRWKDKNTVQVQPKMYLHLKIYMVTKCILCG